MNPRSAAGRTPVPAPGETVPSWMVGLCGVAAFVSALFTLLLFLNR